MAKFKALKLLGKLLKRKKPGKEDTSPRGFTFSPIWRRKKASPADGPRPKRSWVLKVISSVSKKFKAEKPNSAGYCDDKGDEPPVEQGLQLQYDKATTSSYNSLSEFIPTECAGPLVDQQELNEVVTQDREEVTQVNEIDDELEVDGNEGEYRKVVDQEQITWEGDVGQGDDVGLVDDVGRVDDVVRDDGVLIWNWMYIIAVAVIFVLLLYHFN